MQLFILILLLKRLLIMILMLISIDKSFSEILFRLDNWINEGSGWVIERINDQYLNISRYSPLVGSSFIELPKELSKSKKRFD